MATGAREAPSRTSWPRSKASSPRSIAVTASPALVLLLRKLGQPASLAAQRVLGLVVDARGAVERTLDERLQSGIGDEIGGGAQQVLGLAQAGAGWNQLLVALAGSQPARQGIVELAAGSQMRAALAEPVRERRPADEQGLVRQLHRGQGGIAAGAQEPFLHQCVDQCLDLGIRKPGPIQRSPGRDSISADLNQGREQPIELRVVEVQRCCPAADGTAEAADAVVGGEGEIRPCNTGGPQLAQREGDQRQGAKLIAGVREQGVHQLVRQAACRRAPPGGGSCRSGRASSVHRWGSHRRAAGAPACRGAAPAGRSRPAWWRGCGPWAWRRPGRGAR